VVLVAVNREDHRVQQERPLGMDDPAGVTIGVSREPIADALILAGRGAAKGEWNVEHGHRVGEQPADQVRRRVEHQWLLGRTGWLVIAITYPERRIDAGVQCSVTTAPGRSPWPP